MAVRIGHASLDEHGNITGGTAGDQTGKELRIQNWYNKGWNVVLRPKDATLAEGIALSCEAACKNDFIGYDQGGRNSLNAQAKAVGYDLAKISTPCECDCSSLMHVCAIAGGANLKYGNNGHTTRTMVNEYMATDQFQMLTASKYLSTDKYLLRGDILVKEGSHTAMALENGSQAVPEPDIKAEYCSVNLPILEKGMAHRTVEMMQQLLIANDYRLSKYGADGEFGEETENAVLLVQEDNNLEPNGKCGQTVWAALLGQKGVG